MKLTGIKVRQVKPRPYTVADGGGLYIEVFLNGSKLWREKSRRRGGSENLGSLGMPEAIAQRQ